MSTVTIDVTAEDIARGVPVNCDECPIALAASRALGVEAVHVTSRHLYLPRGSAPLPALVGARIRRFDMGFGMEPMSFEVEVPA